MNRRFEPAFPVTDTVIEGRSFEPDYMGMSLRDYFAAKAMQAIYMRQGGSPVDTDEMSMDYTARWAYKQADAMLEAREAA